ncbi:FAD-dependent oxidoreductase [Gemmobacter lanyuensis]
MKTDVAIIGGGAIGAAVAYYLKTMDPSVSVTVIERDPTYAIASTPRASGGCGGCFRCPKTSRCRTSRSLSSKPLPIPWR